MIKPPCQFPYNANAFNSIVMAGLFALIMGFIIGGQISWGFNVDMITCSVIVGSVTFVPSAAFLLLRKRLLIMEEQYIDLPCGLFQWKTQRIAYSQITKIWEPEVQKHVPRLMNLETAVGKFVIAEFMLPDKQIFLDIKDFLISRAPQST